MARTSYVMCVCSQVKRLVYLTMTHDPRSVVMQAALACWTGHLAVTHQPTRPPSAAMCTQNARSAALEAAKRMLSVVRRSLAVVGGGHEHRQTS